MTTLTANRPLKTLMLAALFLTTTRAEASLSYQVSNGNDSGPGSLRQAMLNANGHPGPDTITFAMGANKTITLTAPLPPIFDEMTIDGTTQPGYAGTPLVELDGENAGNTDGFFVVGGPVTIRALVINRFASRGIEIIANSATVEGCYIGTDVTGKIALGNGDGILIGSDLNTIGGATPGTRNVISGNAGDAIAILSGTQNSVRSNYLGVDASGAAALGNGGYGIRVFSKSNAIGEAGAGNVISGNGRGVSLEESNNTVRGNTIGLDASGSATLGNGEDGVDVSAADNTIGGLAAGAGNVISGNASSGIDLGSAATGSTVLGNRIGTDAAGAVALGNAGFSIIIRGAGITIGGSAPGAANLISGNGRGLLLDTAATDNVIQGNTIGLNLTQTAKLPNLEDGIDVYGFGNLIGGSAPGEGNIISGNKIYGMDIYYETAHDNVIQGNKIGTGPDGTTLLGNGYFGIRITGAFDNTIGGTTPGAGNVIAGNGWSAVRVTWGTGNAMLRNSIFENKELGIDLDPRGVSANDILDVDFGPNGGQNYPVITSATVAKKKATISGRLESKANKPYRVELFSTPACDTSGFGEGRTFLAAVDVVTDANGHADWTTSLVAAIVDPHLTATATSTDDGTSEFSPCAAIGGPSPGALQFAASPFVGWEFEQSVKIAVTRTFGSTGAVTVHYATGGGSATPGADYTPVAGTLSFADGEVVKTFQIPVVFDQIDEVKQESIGLTLSGPTGGATLGAWATSQLILIDYDPANPAVTFDDATVVEGAGGAMMAFKVDVTPTDHVVEVGYATADGSALAGQDYDATSGTLIFQPGDAPKTVLVPIIGDNVAEETESFYLDLTSLTGNAAFNDATGEGVIVDDDKPLPANSSAVCTGGTTIAGAKLVIRGLGGSMGDERMTLDGKLVFATGTPTGFDALDSSGRGAQVLIEDVGSGVPLLALTYQGGNPIPAGALGTSPCDPTLTEGWKVNAALTTYRYLNRSGELAAASCAAGSAAQVRLLTLSDRRATTGKVRVRLVRNKAAIAMPTGPVRATVVLGADASASAGGACAVHTFAGCTLNALGNKLTCK